MKNETKTALVTGAGTGIGQAIACQLANDGFRVLVIGRTESTLQETSKLNDNISYFVADITKEDDNKKIVEKIKEKYGHLDVLVHNAGVAPVSSVEEADLKQFDMTFNINVRGLFDLTKNCLSMLKETKGNVINISSSLVLKPMANMSVYAAAKSAVRTLTVAWAKEWAKDEVRVNSIAVGPIETPIYGKTELSEEEIKKHIERVTSNIPLKRFGKPQDIANMVSFLASKKANFITGADFAVDGGFGI